jgi:hypothetical protein
MVKLLQSKEETVGGLSAPSVLLKRVVTFIPAVKRDRTVWTCYAVCAFFAGIIAPSWSVVRVTR